MTEIVPDYSMRGVGGVVSALALALAFGSCGESEVDRVKREAQERMHRLQELGAQISERAALASEASDEYRLSLAKQRGDERLVAELKERRLLPRAARMEADAAQRRRAEAAQTAQTQARIRALLRSAEELEVLEAKLAELEARPGVNFPFSAAANELKQIKARMKILNDRIARYPHWGRHDYD